MHIKICVHVPFTLNDEKSNNEALSLSNHITYNTCYKIGF